MENSILHSTGSLLYAFILSIGYIAGLNLRMKIRCRGRGWSFVYELFKEWKFHNVCVFFYSCDHRQQVLTNKTNTIKPKFIYWKYQPILFLPMNFWTNLAQSDSLYGWKWGTPWVRLCNVACREGSLRRFASRQCWAVSQFQHGKKIYLNCYFDFHHNNQ